MTRLGLLATMLVVLCGCAVKPPPAVPVAQMCSFVRHSLVVDIPDSLGRAEEAAGAESLPPLSDALRAALGPNDPAALRSGQGSAMLFLSGGSLHGAFGAGFLDGVAHGGAGLPEFRVVTGISTGSILSTFAFLGDTQRLVDGYSITSESQLLIPYIHIVDGKPTARSLVSVLEHGAVANLDPLRARLRSEFTPAVLWQVAQRHATGARLYVGAVDVDTGQAVAFDLGDMATRYFGPRGAPPVESAPETTDQARIRDCYVSAVLASSSAPLAAPPVFIDNRMYVDGGARFGMFSDEIGGVINDEVREIRSVPPRTDMYLIVNGNLLTEEQCGKAAPVTCPPYGKLEGAHAAWNLIELASRSEQILVNQVYRFSAARILDDDPANPPHFARMNPDSDSHVYTMPPDADLGTGTMTCAEWHAEDKRLLNPVQFFPRYMRCLIDYGRQRGRAGQWDSQPMP
jgi:predicted acylesterase/phospholipase RssA